MGAEALRDGLSSGVTGLVSQPVRGAMKGGTVGAVTGVGMGVLGLLTKPVSGVAGFASKLSEGLGSEAKKIAANTIDTGETDRHFVALRVRQPRWMPDGVLRPYPRQAPLMLAPEEEEPRAPERSAAGLG